MNHWICSSFSDSCTVSVNWVTNWKSWLKLKMLLPFLLPRFLNCILTFLIHVYAFHQLIWTGSHCQNYKWRKHTISPALITYISTHVHLPRKAKYPLHISSSWGCSPLCNCCQVAQKELWWFTAGKQSIKILETPAVSFTLALVCVLLRSLCFCWNVCH